jgi:protein SCO1/2
MFPFQYDNIKYFRIPLLVVLLSVNHTVLCAELNSLGVEKTELELALKYTLLPEPLPLKPFKLSDQNNRPFGVNELKGKWTFMYFGYTSCPDVCPTTIGELNIVSRKLAEDHRYAKDTQYVFVSVDPRRDTPEMLKKFTAYFELSLLGAVAPVKDLKKLTDQMEVKHRRLIVRDPETNKQEYAVEHSSDIYLIDPQGKVVARFSSPHSGKQIKQLYVKIRQKAAKVDGV